VVIDDIVPPTPGSANAVMNEANGVVHLMEGKVKELAYAEINSQNVPEG